MMMNSPLRRIASVILGLWLAFGPVLAVAPVAAMTAHMSMSDDGGSGCCPDMDRKACALVCVSVWPLAVAAHTSHLSAIGLRDHGGPWRPMALSDHCVSPDPPPPKPVSLQ